MNKGVLSTDLTLLNTRIMDLKRNSVAYLGNKKTNMPKNLLEAKLK